eukprot:11353597-Ditylum_brightwellii.AAC.1
MHAPRDNQDWDIPCESGLLQFKGFISKCTKFINDNGGFKVWGWLKRCIINYRNLFKLESSGGE